MKQVMIERLQEWVMSWQWPDRVVWCKPWAPARRESRDEGLSGTESWLRASQGQVRWHCVHCSTACHNHHNNHTSFHAWKPHYFPILTLGFQYSIRQCSRLYFTQTAMVTLCRAGISPTELPGPASQTRSALLRAPARGDWTSHAVLTLISSSRKNISLKIAGTLMPITDAKVMKLGLTV